MTVTTKNGVVRMSKDADVVLSRIKQEVLETTGKRVYKRQILDWIVVNCLPTHKECRDEFYNWVKALD
jgi:hypothetical protein